MISTSMVAASVSVCLVLSYTIQPTLARSVMVSNAKSGQDKPIYTPPEAPPIKTAPGRRIDTGRRYQMRGESFDSHQQIEQ
jgi:hypothetical protein